MSDYQNRLIKDLELKPPDCNKLLLTLQDKKNYVVHYRNLQFYLKQGMKLKCVHRVLEFEQECWMEPYIRINTEFRKNAKSDFEKNFYKLMNNSIFGETMENLRNCVDIKIVRSSETDKIRKLVATPLYSRHVIFSNNLVGIDMCKKQAASEQTGLHRDDDPSQPQNPDVRFFLQRAEKKIRPTV